MQCSAVAVLSFLNEPQGKRVVVAEFPLNIVLALFATLEKTGQSQKQMRSVRRCDPVVILNLGHFLRYTHEYTFSVN